MYNICEVWILPLPYWSSGVWKWDIPASLFLGPTCLHLCRSAAQDPSGFITYHGFPKEKCFVLCAFMSVKCTPQGSPRISRHPSAWVPARAHQNPQKIQGSKRVMDHHGSCMAICFLGAIGCPMVPIIRNTLSYLSLCHSKISSHLPTSKPPTCRFQSTFRRPIQFFWPQRLGFRWFWHHW